MPATFGRTVLCQYNATMRQIPAMGDFRGSIQYLGSSVLTILACQRPDDTNHCGDRLSTRSREQNKGERGGYVASEARCC